MTSFQVIWKKPAQIIKSNTFVNIFAEQCGHSRRIELQSFTDRICRHPVLAGSEVFPFYQNIFRLSCAEVQPVFCSEQNIFLLFEVQLVFLFSQISFILCSYEVQPVVPFYQNIFSLSGAHLNWPRCGNILCRRPMRRSGQRWKNSSQVDHDIWWYMMRRSGQMLLFST